MPAESTASKKTARRYDSPVRAQRAKETRAAVIAAALELFTTKGWAGTGMRDVARGAGVAIETVYKHFSSKPVLLQAVIDIAAAGDDQDLAVAERDEFVAIGQGPRKQRVAAAASLCRAVNERTVGLAMVMREAAPADEQIAEMLAATRGRQRQDVGSGIRLISGQTPTDAEIDEVWAMTSPEVYLLLVHEMGWTPEAYETWMAATFDRIVPRASRPSSASNGRGTAKTTRT